MDVYRRNLMKGALVGSTLLTLGIPPITPAAAAAGNPGRLRLLLGSGAADAEFAAGARTAFAANARRAATGHDAATHDATTPVDARSVQSGLEVIKLQDGLLNEYEKVARLLEAFRDTRWIAVMDDGSAAVFTELVRHAGGSLVSLGSHASSGEPLVRGSAAGIPGLRQVWAAASPSHAAGGILAARLVESHRSFSIVESFFSTQGVEERGAQERGAANKLPPGFDAWRRDGAGFRHNSSGHDPAYLDPAYLYCAGVSPEDGCQLLGWDADPAWTPVDRESGPETVAGTAASGERRSASGNDEPRGGGWVEAVGYAVTAAALGAGAGHESCSACAHVYQSDVFKRGTPDKAGRFTSFVIDI